MSWRAVRGHEEVVAGFRRVVNRGRLAHAYLFTGPAGVGKKLFAGELARALLCEGGGDLEACDRCPSCLQMDAGAHPDYFPSVRPPEALEFPIDLMRSLCQNFALKPARGRGKVIVLDDADDLNEESANCFLKTLEEPPPRSVLILIGSTAERQLPTIVSRCQVVRFHPLPAGLVDELLLAGGVTDPARRGRLVRMGRGSPGDALRLADPSLWEFRDRFLDGLTRPAPDARALGADWWVFLEAAGKESAARRGRASLVVRLVVDFLDDALQVSVGGESLRTGPEEAARVGAFAERVGTEAILEMLDRCMETDFHVDRRVQLELAVEALVDAWAQRVPVTGRG